MKLLYSVAALCRFCSLLTDIMVLLYPYDGQNDLGDCLQLRQRVYTHVEALNDWHETMLEDSEHHDTRDAKSSVVILFENLIEIYHQYDQLDLSQYSTDSMSRSAKAALCNYRVMLTLFEPTGYEFERLQAKNELRAILRGTAQSLRAIVNADMMTNVPIGL